MIYQKCWETPKTEKNRKYGECGEKDRKCCKFQMLEKVKIGGIA